MCSYGSGCRCENCMTKQRVRTYKYTAERRKTDPGFAREHRRRLREITCPGCNVVAKVGRRAKFCSASCAARNRKAPTGRQPSQLDQCAWCHALHIGKAACCSVDCRDLLARSKTRARYSPLRSALANRDMVTAAQLLLETSRVTETGCWEWPQVEKSGYPCLTNQQGLHRLVLEAKHGAPLGVQQAHHTCANRACVNPDHLQPVTHYDNMAEMHQRRTYLARIAELEQALTTVAPNHPVLNTVPVL